MDQKYNNSPSDFCCADVRELLSAYLDGELSAAECAAVKAHLEACPVCADEAALLSRLREEIAAASVIPPASLRAGVLAAVRRERRARLLRRVTSIGAVGIAAMFCVVVIGGMGHFGQTMTDNAAPMANRAAEEPAAYDVQAELHGGDGLPESTLTEESASSAVQAVRLTDEAREITTLDAMLNGRADESDLMMPDGKVDRAAAVLAEEQIGTLCVVERASDLSSPLVYDLSSGRVLTLADFVGGEAMLAELSASVGASLTPDTLYRPTATGLVILENGEMYVLPWDASSAVIAGCVDRWQMRDYPLCTPDGSVLIG